MDRGYRESLTRNGVKMIKKVVIVIILLSITVGILTYFEQYNLSDFSIVDISIDRNDVNYMAVKNATELEEALLNPEIELIEIMNDIDLGYNLIKSELKTEKIFKGHNIPLTHPKLKDTGVSKLEIKNKENLIIYSNNGSSILHCNIRIENSKNIKIYNLAFKELWEWDEEGKAEYDRNDWDYVTIKNSNNICVSNCEFSKAYDGIIDIKNNKNVTIEYCKLNPIDIDDEFFDEQFEYLENNKDKYEMYRFLREDVELAYQEVKELFSYQFKVFLIENEEEEKDSNIIIHDCLFINAKTRMPLVRNSEVYIYNVYIDSAKLLTIRKNLLRDDKYYKIKEKYKKIVTLNSYGIISSKKSYVFAKNIDFKGTKYPYSEIEAKGQKFEERGKIIFCNEKDKVKNMKENLESLVGVKSE